ncbi:MAG: hypothetical protein ABIR81_12220 [Ginsengibacter sp.]
MQKLKYKNISYLINQGKSNSWKFAGYIGLGIGVFLLLVSLQIFLNINRLLKDNNPKKDGFDFLSVTKQITNDNMGKDNTFSTAELSDFKNVPQIAEVAPVITNQFRVKANAGSMIPFSTDLFLESINKQFLDTLPAGFTWQPGQQNVPVIFSSDFLEMYNVFAPAQGLPQLSPKTIAAVGLGLECYGNTGTFTFRANIVALSDRINSVIVPQSFIEWGNKYLAGTNTQNPSRIYIKIKDANDPALLKYLDDHNYRVNKDKTKFGRVKTVLQAVVSLLGFFGILIICLALLLFSFYLKLIIANSRQNLQLMIILGYSPGWLTKIVSRKWIVLYLIIITAALVCTGVVHYLFSSNFMQANISFLPDWKVFGLAALLFILAIYFNYTLIKKELFRIA